PMKRNWLLCVAVVFVTALAVRPLIAQDQKEGKGEKAKSADGEKAKAGEGEKAKADEGEKKAEAKAEKAKGDVGLLDAEKNYMILVTKEGKLITLDFDQKTKV